MTGRNDPCWCGSQKKWKKCHFPNPSPTHQYSQYAKQYGILLKNEEQILGIRRASHLAAAILDQACQSIRIGTTTAEVDQLVAQLHRDAGAVPAALHYGSPPFPYGICTSVNDMVCHGIPDHTPLQEGDIVNIDVATIYDGYYGDCSRMVMLGSPPPKRKLVYDVSLECLLRALAVCKPGVAICEIGEAITTYAESQGCSVVHQFVGHGVGVRFHEPPQIPHHRNSLQIPLAEGMTFTIEPMINAGTPDVVIDSNNHWEARTRDGQPSAQWEHTLLITASGYEILTPWKL